MSLTRGQHDVSAACVLHADVNEPVEIAFVTPSLVEELVKDKLADTARTLGADIGMLSVSADDLLRGCHPTNARAGCENLGEGIHAHHATINVKSEERWDKRLDELLVRLGRVGLGGVGAGVRLHLQEVVRLVLENDEVVLLSDLVDVAPPLFALRGASGVLAGGDGVENKGLLAAPDCLVPVGQDMVERGGEQTLLVHGDTNHSDAHGSGGLDGGGESVVLGENKVASLAEHSQGHVEGGGGANGHGAVPIAVWRVVDNLGVLDQVAEELCAAGSLAVVEGGANVEKTFVLGQIMLAGCYDLSALMHLFLSVVANLRGLEGYLVKGKVLRRGQAAAEGD